MTSLVTCAIVYTLISGAFDVLVAVDADDCEAYSIDNAARAKEAAEGNGATAELNRRPAPEIGAGRQSPAEISRGPPASSGHRTPGR